jgi:hypothetical protein
MNATNLDRRGWGPLADLVRGRVERSGEAAAPGRRDRVDRCRRGIERGDTRVFGRDSEGGRKLPLVIGS